MNAIFNIERYAKLEKRNFFLSKMHYVYILGGLAGLYLLSMLMKILTGTSLSAIVYLAAFTIIVAGPCLFEKSRSKHASVFDFILPASTFEKFLSFWVKYVIIIPVLIALLFLLLNTISGIISIDAVRDHADSMIPGKITGDTKGVFMILATQAAFMGGYFYFRRYAFAKTSVILLIGGIFFLIIGIILGVYFLSGQQVSFNLDTDTGDRSYEIGHNIGIAIETFLENSLIKTLDRIADIVFVVGMWIFCFFKLRETEI